MPTSREDLFDALRAHGQEHLAVALGTLEEAAAARLRRQIAGLDLGLVDRLRALVVAPPADAAPPALAPPELFPLRRGPGEQRAAEEATRHGEKLLAAGKAGFVLVAGGQASRLGYDGPKGAFPVGPLSGRTLFACHARRLLALARRHGVATPWYVMTSAANHAATRSFFESHAWFGLDEKDVFFFEQEMLPALDEEGRMLRAAPDALFMAPNGHGGCLSGLRASGALADMRARGLEQLSYFQVDNPLARPADPLFLGLHAARGADMSSKVVEKRDADEKVGVIGFVDGRLGCIEYSDLPAELREAREPSGALAFRAGNIAIHVLSVDFLERVTEGALVLPWHVARKKMRVWGPGGEEERVGFKFETFVFDALAHAERSVTLEVARELEFSPVKNASGEDSPDTARRALCRLHAAWVRAAGLPLPAPDEGGVHPVEIDPLLAESEEEFAARVAAGSFERHERGNGHLYLARG